MAETTSPNTTIMKASCHCKTHSYEFKIPNDQLPLATSHCYCNMCRQTNGGVFESYTSLPSSVHPYTATSPPPPTLKSFSCTTGSNRYFCSKCGTHLFYNYTADSSWSINTGAFATLQSGLHKFTHHIYVSEGPQEDGIGLFNLLDDGLPRYVKGDESGPPLKPEELNSLLEQAKPSKSAVLDPSQRLLASCYCGRVRAKLSRPSAHPENKWLKQFATPDKTKWEGSFDACESCRLSTGSVVTCFVFPPAEHLEWLPSAEPGSGPEKEPGAGGPDDWRARAGMTWWRSSEEVVRGFCGTCGASALYQCTDREGMEPLGDQGWTKWGEGKDAISDLYIGLLRTSNKEGERLADWVSFEETLHHSKDLGDYSGQLKAHLEKGSKKFVQTQGNS